MNFNILDGYGNKVECSIIGTFVKEDKKFVIYTDGTVDHNDNKKEVYASLYEIEEDNLILLPINDEKDWDLVDEYLDDGGIYG